MTILIVEDSRTQLQLMAAIIERMGGYQVTTADDGNEALEVAFATIPDLIILDIHLPSKDGFEIREALREDERTAHIPIIMLTALTLYQEEAKSKSDAFLLKPIIPQQLLQQIHKLLETSQSI